MPILAGLFVTFFSGLITFLGKFMVYKYAVVVAFVTVLTAITAAFYATISALLNGLNAALPSMPGIEIAVWAAAPPVLPVAISACIAADVAVAVYRLNLVQMRMLKV